MNTRTAEVQIVCLTHFLCPSISLCPLSTENMFARHRRTRSWFFDWAWEPLQISCRKRGSPFRVAHNGTSEHDNSQWGIIYMEVVCRLESTFSCNFVFFPIDLALCQLPRDVSVQVRLLAALESLHMQINHILLLICMCNALVSCDVLLFQLSIWSCAVNWRTQSSKCAIFLERNPAKPHSVVNLA